MSRELFVIYLHLPYFISVRTQLHKVNQDYPLKSGQILKLLLILSVINPIAFAQDSSFYHSDVSWHQMFTRIPSDYVGFFHSAFSSEHSSTLITVGALTGSLWFVDQTTWKNTNLLFKKSNVEHYLSDYTIKIGDGKYQFISAALFAVPGLVFNDKTAVRTGSNIVEAVISTGLFVQVLKRMTGRQSPAASTEKAGDWTPFPSLTTYQKDQPAFYSFPSGHLSSAAAVLTVIANNYPDQNWIRPVSYPLLGLLGVSLVSKGMHWYSDFPLAFLIGHSFGNIIAPEKTLISHSNENSSLTIFPALSYNGMNLGLSYSF